MNAQEFISKVYLPTVAQVNGKKVKDMSDSQRMILAINECLLAFNSTKWSEALECDRLIAEVEHNKQYKEMTKMEYIEQQASIWMIPSSSLITNIKKLFA